MNKKSSEYGYTRTMLYLYPYLSQMAQTMRKRMEIRAALSYRNENTEELLEKLLNDGYLADKLEEIRLRLDDLLAELPEKERFALDYRYCHRQTYDKYGKQIEDYRLSERSFFRYLQLGLKHFSWKLQCNSMDEKWFLQEFSCLDWAMEIYRRVIGGAQLHRRKRNVFQMAQKRGVNGEKKDANGANADGA